MSDTTTVARKVVHSTRGSSHGPITRLVSPSDLGEVIKPFIFLDRFETAAGGPPLGFGMHPHSGIATLTYLMNGQMQYEDTTGEHGERGTLPNRGVEWMMAGGGVWHRGNPVNAERVMGFQLWVAMPPELELAEAHSIYLGPEGVPHVGPARVLLGAYEGAVSPIPAPSDMTYLGVHLQAGETWRFVPPAGHTVAWAAVGEGTLTAPAALRTGDLVVFDEAHHLTAYRTGGKVRKTENYKLAEALKDHSRDLMLLSATPHQGNHFQFWMLAQLLNPTLFGSPELRSRRPTRGCAAGPWPH